MFKTLKNLVAPLVPSVLVTQKTRQFLRQTDEITLRADTSYFDQFLNRDLLQIEEYTSQEAFSLIWPIYQQSAMCSKQLGVLKKIIPTLGLSDLKQGSQALHTSQVDRYTVYACHENKKVYLHQMALPPPYRYVYLYLRMPTEVHARNRSKKEIYKYYEFFLKESGQLGPRDIGMREIATFIDMVEQCIPTTNEFIAPSVEPQGLQTAATSSSVQPKERQAIQTIPTNIQNNSGGGTGKNGNNSGGPFGLGLFLLLGLVGLAVLKYLFSSAQPSKTPSVFKRLKSLEDNKSL